VTALCNQPEAFASDLDDDQSPYLLQTLLEGSRVTRVYTDTINFIRIYEYEYELIKCCDFAIRYAIMPSLVIPRY